MINCDGRISNNSIQSSDIIYASDTDSTWPSTDIWDGAINNTSYTTGTVAEEIFGSLGSNEYVYVEYFSNITDVAAAGATSDYYSYFRVGPTYSDPRIDPPLMTIPEKLVFIVAVVPLIPLVAMWIRGRQERVG